MAYIGHPLVGDMKYNSRNFEFDSAFLPRIFLHCFKMEFKEFDGSLFVASSELAPDLQAALKRIEALSDSGTGKVPTATSDILPGLARILEDSKYDHCPPAFTAPDGTAKAHRNRIISHRCLNCKCREEASATMIQKGKQVAMSWKLVKQDVGHESSDQEPPTAPTWQKQIDNGETPWGPGMLWVPTALQVFEQADNRAEASLEVPADCELASVEEVGSPWGPFGMSWSWAHNGIKRNGWFRLCHDGQLSTKWGMGNWKVLRPDGNEIPLLLVTFNGVEHALRLIDDKDGRFDVVSIRSIEDGRG